MANFVAAGGAPAEEEEEEEEEEEITLVKREDIIYCGVCSMPPEYCEFNRPVTYVDCLKWQSDNHPELLPEGKSLEDLVAALSMDDSKPSASAGGAGGAVATAEKSEGAGQGGEGVGDDEEGDKGEDGEGDGKKKKSKRGGGPKPIKKKDPTTGGTVTITRMSRNKRKSVTVVTGLDTYSDLRLKDVSKVLGKAFACGASVSDTASGGKEIVIQGDVLDTLPSLLTDTFKIPEDKIKLEY